ncbi:MAG: hypothetical protein K9J16_09080 [Melioribacteraceae bacterium]|nr:hypothetical protein [Melioribacteraceae bacterium]MCF8353241.1 hypothetical protein [Melioribacteraceae bacterium]MCF8393973.1 hypothetical protein [Melioribacteraceae bacterium]MCF8418725.1 hypothetical protein [Melioribacteraceae bacterium]
MIKRILLTSIIICFYQVLIIAQQTVDVKNLKSDFAKSERRVQFREKLIAGINNTLSNNFYPENSSNWIQAFDNASLYLIKNDTVHSAIKTVLMNTNTAGTKLTISALKAVHSLFINDFTEEIEAILNQTGIKEIFALAVHHGLKNGLHQPQYYNDLLINKFIDWENDSMLKMLRYDLSGELKPGFNEDKLRALFSHQFQENKTIIYSIFREDRTIPGLTIIKKPDGKFVKDTDGNIFNIPQLALSVTNLPGYMRTGNTPTGIFSIVGYYITPTEEIGPTPIILTRIPFEKTPDIFFHKQNKNKIWTIDDYKNLLPDEFQDEKMFYESYYAGKYGRGLIIMHGSVDDPHFYKDQSYYPLTPSKGCITSIELWSDKNGDCIESDQAELASAFFSTGQLKGFLIVFEIDDKTDPVTIDEILPYLELD